MRALAVPILDRKGTINSSSHVSTVSMEGIIREYVPIMQQIARKITDVLP